MPSVSRKNGRFCIAPKSLGQRLWVLTVLGGLLLSLCVVTAYQLTAVRSYGEPCGAAMSG